MRGNKVRHGFEGRPLELKVDKRAES